MEEEPAGLLMRIGSEGGTAPEEAGMQVELGLIEMGPVEPVRPASRSMESRRPEWLSAKATSRSLSLSLCFIIRVGADTC